MSRALPLLLMGMPLAALLVGAKDLNQQSLSLNSVEIHFLFVVLGNVVGGETRFLLWQS